MSVLSDRNAQSKLSEVISELLAAALRYRLPMSRI